MRKGLLGRAVELAGGVRPRDGRGSHQPLQLQEGHGEQVYLEDTGGKAACVTVVPTRVPQAHQLLQGIFLALPHKHYEVVVVLCQTAWLTLHPGEMMGLPTTAQSV